MLPRRALAQILIGTGVGLAIGGRFAASAAFIAGAVVAVAGLLIVAIPGSPSRDLIAGNSADAPATRPAPPLSDLGTRVEQVLKLAEKQADEHRAAARREADQITAAARAEADRIKGD